MTENRISLKIFFYSYIFISIFSLHYYSFLSFYYILFFSIILLFHCHFYSPSWTGLEYWIQPELFVMAWGRSNLIYCAVLLACSFCVELYKIKWARRRQLSCVTNKSKLHFLVSIVYSFIHNIHVIMKPVCIFLLSIGIATVTDKSKLIHKKCNRLLVHYHV